MFLESISHRFLHLQGPMFEDRNNSHQCVLKFASLHRAHSTQLFWSAGRITMQMGPLVAHSVAPLVDSKECESVMQECEARARALGGWTTQRHENYPTTDVPVGKLPMTKQWLVERLLPDIAYPFLARAFGFAMPDAVVAPTLFRVVCTRIRACLFSSFLVGARGSVCEEIRLASRPSLGVKPIPLPCRYSLLPQTTDRWSKVPKVPPKGNPTPHRVWGSWMRPSSRHESSQALASATTRG